MPDSAADAVLFASVALLVACTASTQNTAINVLVAGRLAWNALHLLYARTHACSQGQQPWLHPAGIQIRPPGFSLSHPAPPAGAVCQLLAFKFNLGRAGNAISLWQGLQPPEVFIYVFLPPLLLDSALRIDYFIFQKVRAQALVHPCTPVHASRCM